MNDECPMCSGEGHCELCNAESRIAALEAEVAQLTGQLDSWRRSADVARLRRVEAAARAALDAMVWANENSKHFTGGDERRIAAAIDALRAALEAKL